MKLLDGKAADEVELWGSFVPTGRASTAEDRANAALSLASDLAANITGAIIPVDGGFSHDEHASRLHRTPTWGP